MPRLTSGLEVQNQTTTATLDVPGTDIVLRYDSSRVSGRVDGRKIEIPLFGGVSQSELRSIDQFREIRLIIRVAGQFETASYEPDTSTTEHVFVWDGRDGLGRPVNGTVEAVVRLGYVYGTVYRAPSESAASTASVSGGGGGGGGDGGGSSDQIIGPSRSFGLVPEADRVAMGRYETIIWETEKRTLTAIHNQSVGFGRGWTPNHLRSPNWRERRIQALTFGDRTLEKFVPENGAEFDPVDDINDTLYDALQSARDIAFAPDGTMYFYTNDVIYGVGPDGTPRHVGGGGEREGDGIPATDASLNIVNQGFACGPDGTVYVAGAYGTVRRIGTDGVISVIAGSISDREDVTKNESLGGATETTLENVVDVAVGPDGSVYFAETDTGAAGLQDRSGTVRRITQDGVIEPIAGAPKITYDDDSGDFFGPDDEVIDNIENEGVYEGSATEKFFAPLEIAVDSDGVVYVVDNLPIDTEDYDDRVPVVRVVRPDGDTQIYAGSPSHSSTSSEFVPSSEGSLATDVEFSTVENIAIGPGNTLYLLESDHHVVYKIVGGRLQVLAGTGDDDRDGPIEDGVAPRGTSLDPYEALGVAPDGDVFFNIGKWFGDAYPAGPSGEFAGGIGRVGRGVGSTRESSLVPSPDVEVVHEFDDDRHRRTMDGIMGTTRRVLEYDDEGLVTAFVDDEGNRTTVERDDDGSLTGITSPDGLRTTFTIGSDGTLDSATFPDGTSVSLDYGTGGLLERLEDGRGTVTTFSYDDLGRTTRRTDPTGAETDLVRSEADDGYTVKRISPEMREVTHSVGSEASGASFESTCCGGTTSGTTITGDGSSWSVSRALGGSISLTQGPDPRFGDLAPVTEEAVVTSPEGRESVTTTDRSAVVDDEDDPLSVTSHTETVTVNGRTYERGYSTTDTPEGVDSVFEITTAEYRTRSLSFAGGDLVEMSVDGIDPVTVDYDDRGRLTEITQADATTTMEYDDDGYLSALVDAVGDRTELVRDSVGRVQEHVAPSGATHETVYDDSDNLERLVRPNDEVHAFTHTARDRLSVYSPPEGGTESITYDGDGLPTELTRPSGRTITNTYGPGGRLASTSHPDADVEYTRDGSTNRVSEISRTPAGDGATQTLSIGRDGRAITELEFGGPASGTFAYSHDDNGFVTEITYPDGTARSLSHDDDGLTTEAGPFSFDRDGPDGAPTEIDDGTLTISLTYDSRGRVESRTHTIEDSGTPFYRVEYSYDAANRIEERTETVYGSSTTETFGYDADGRLTAVRRNKAAVEEYEYDANGNRTSRTVSGTDETATYAAGDRVADHGGTNYGYDADGFVTERGDMGFSYSAAGELLAATRSERTVTYAYDGYSRRVARTDADGTTEYLYGDPSAPSRVTVARDPDGTRTRYHYDPNGRVIALERDGDWYYVATDQVGTPRVVVDADGTVRRKIDRDSYGVVQSDTNPEFTLHVGFAGGIPDPATGLVRFGQRDYDPAAGRWTARDPALLLGKQDNFYEYVFGDPINGVDRNGLSWECWWEGTKENYNKTIDNIDPAEMAADKIAEKAGYSGPGTSAKDIAKEGAKTAAKEMAKGATTKAALKTAAKKMARSTGVSTALDASMRAGVGIGSAINPFRENSLGEQLGDTLYETLNEDESRRRPDRDNTPGGDDGGPGGGGDCGEKSPENC